MSLVKIVGGTVYDPKNDIDGEIKDIWIQDGRVIDAPVILTPKLIGRSMHVAWW